MRTVFLSGLLSVLLLSASGQSFADEISLGQAEYSSSCAACHGADGKGSGPLTDVISIKIPDLTQLSKNNNGVFPFEYAYQVIDGRKEVGAHGSREMPVWGSRYMDKASRPYASDLLDDQTLGLISRTRILSVIDYLYSIQE